MVAIHQELSSHSLIMPTALAARARRGKRFQCRQKGSDAGNNTSRARDLADARQKWGSHVQTFHFYDARQMMLSGWSMQGNSGPLQRCGQFHMPCVRPRRHTRATREREVQKARRSVDRSAKLNFCGSVRTFFLFFITIIAPFSLSTT